MSLYDFVKRTVYAPLVAGVLTAGAFGFMPKPGYSQNIALYEPISQHNNSYACDKAIKYFNEPKRSFVELGKDINDMLDLEMICLGFCECNNSLSIENDSLNLDIFDMYMSDELGVGQLNRIQIE